LFFPLVRTAGEPANHMTSDRSYRLDNYRITVLDDVLVRWEQHVPLGVARSGKCYVYGEVLIIGKKGRDEDGFLIGEFVDRLRKLPFWTRTRYYCFAGELIDTATGQGLDDAALERFSSFADRNCFVAPESKAASPGAWRLGHYRIAVAANSSVSWQAYGELNRIMGGPCSIESDILIIGPQEHDDEAQGKQKFLDALNRLPQWDKTMAWCRGSVLRLCRDRQQEENSGIIGWLRERMNDRPADEQLSHPTIERREPKRKPKPEPLLTSDDVKRYEEAAKKLLVSGGNAMKKAWLRFSAGKTWFKWLAVLVAALVLAGVTAGLYIAENWHHGFKKHHHKHHDH